jgi:hypothetical protein
LARVLRAEVRDFLVRDLGVNGVCYGAALPAAIDRLAPEGGWRLALSGDPADAMPLIDAMLEETARRA